MKRFRTALLPLLIAAVLLWPEQSHAQTVQPSRSGGSVVLFGQNRTVAAGESVAELVLMFGSATIDGRVDGDLVVVVGSAHLSKSASVGGDVVVVGGSATVEAGAVANRDFVVVGGTFDGPPGFSPGGEQVVIGSPALARPFEAFVPWVTRGLLWGRPIVPNLPWIWGVIGVLLLVYAAINLVFDGSVRACAETIADRPLTALMTGLLVLILIGPVSLLLTVSVVGIAVVPIVLCSVLVAAIVGRIGVARWIGMSILRQPSQESRLAALGAFAVGFAMLCLAYMVPILGFVTWTMVSVVGLGTATLTFLAAYSRENPAPVGSAAPGVAPPAGNETYISMPSAAPSAAVLRSSAEPAVSPAVSDLASFPHAAFSERLAAFVLDVILVLVVQQLLDLTRRDGTIFPLLLAYHIGFWTWKGTTVGGIICQLRLVRVDGAPLRFVDALVRGLSSLFSLAVLGLGCLWILKDPERQAWHDKIAGTYVVKVPRNWPL